MLPLATKYKNFDVQSVEARDKYGIPVSGRNVSASSSQIFPAGGLRSPLDVVFISR